MRQLRVVAAGLGRARSGQYLCARLKCEQAIAMSRPPPAVVETRGIPTPNTQPLGTVHVFEMTSPKPRDQCRSSRGPTMLLLCRKCRRGERGGRCSASQLLERMVSAGLFRGGRAALASASAAHSVPSSLLGPLPPKLAGWALSGAEGSARAGSGSSSARGTQRYLSVAFATSTDEILFAQSLTHPRVLKWG